MVSDYLTYVKGIIASQLSPSGTIATLASRRIVLVSDDSGNVEQARALLKRLDVAARQYSVNLELFSLSDDQARSTRAEARLPGGWIRVAVAASRQHASTRSQFSLRLTSGSEGSLESGTIQPYRRQTKQWLAGYGVIRTNSVELIPITSGFYATVRPAGEGHVNVRIVPWMRLNSSPDTNQNRIIEMAGAATEVTIPIGENITIAATDEEASLLGDAMLASGSSTGKRSFAIRLSVEQR